MSDPSEAQQTIELFLSRLGVLEAITGFEVLQHWLSGASTYRLHFAERDAVLKVTLPDRGRLAVDRTRRELGFYSDLAVSMPVRVPEALATYEGPEGWALLLVAYRPSPPAGGWTASEFVEAARQLGRLHAAFWRKEETLAGLPWLKRRQAGETAAEVDQARAWWQGLAGQPRLAAVLAPETMRWLDRLLSAMPRLERTLESLPLTLCQGDCIPDNVLRGEDGGLIWADWQEARLSHGPEDLGFFLQRALIGGATIPEDDAWAAYGQALQTGIGEDVPLAALRRVGDAADLWSRALYWPAYLQESPEGDIAAMMRQIRILAERCGVA